MTSLRAQLAAWVKKANFARERWKFWKTQEERRTTAESKARAHAERVRWYRRLKTVNTVIGLIQKRIAKEKPTEMSMKGIKFLVGEEGSVPYAYNDPAGHATFGVGHLIHLGPVTTADKRKYGTRENPRRALVLTVFKQDIPKYEKAVMDATGGKLKKAYQFDACVSLCFNIGIAGFARSSVAARIRTGDLKGAADAFLMWDNPSILRPRRERERTLFLKGKY